MTNSAGPEFVLGGNRGDSTSGTIMNGQGGGGSCWSTNAGPSNDLAYRLALYAASKEVRPAHLNIYKLSAISLRCLAPPTPSTNYSLTPLDQTLCCAATALVPVCTTKVRTATTGLVLRTLMLPALTFWACIIAEQSALRASATSTTASLSAA